MSLMTVRLERCGDTAVVTCAGELDLSTRRLLDRAVDRALRRPPPRLEVDCTQVCFFAAAGANALARAADLCAGLGVEFGLVCGPPVRRVLDLVGLWWLGRIDDGPALQRALGAVPPA